jgi:hypothetical protein
LTNGTKSRQQQPLSSESKRRAFSKQQHKRKAPRTGTASTTASHDLRIQTPQNISHPTISKQGADLVDMDSMREMIQDERKHHEAELQIFSDTLKSVVGSMAARKHENQ